MKIISKLCRDLLLEQEERKLKKEIDKEYKQKLKEANTDEERKSIKQEWSKEKKTKLEELKQNFTPPNDNDLTTLF